jgi:hypothetical protein
MPAKSRSEASVQPEKKKPGQQRFFSWTIALMGDPFPRNFPNFPNHKFELFPEYQQSTQSTGQR